MSETEALQTNNNDNASWVSCVKSLLFEQIVNPQVSTHQRWCFQQSVLAAASLYNNTFFKKNLIYCDGFFFFLSPMSCKSLQAVFHIVLKLTDTSGFLEGNQSQHIWFEK